LLFGPSGTGETIGSNRSDVGDNPYGLDFYTLFQPRLRVTQVGNVGIGTSAPGQKPEVAGGIKFTGTGSVLTFPDGTTQATAAATGSTAYVQNTTTPQASSNFNISGNGVIGGNSTSAANAGAVLSGAAGQPPHLELRGSSLVTTTNTTPYIDFAENNTVDYTTRLISQSGVLSVNGPSTTTTIFRVNGNAVVTGTMTVNGTNVTSDRRFKTNVRPLAAVLALRGVRYHWNALGVRHGGTAGAGQVGLIAQEVEALYPELVGTDAEGYKSVNYAQLAPVLIEAIKELAAQNEALKARNAALQAGSAADKAATLESLAQRLQALEAGGGQASK